MTGTKESFEIDVLNVALEREISAGGRLRDELRDTRSELHKTRLERSALKKKCRLLELANKELERQLKKGTD
jgi:hypothetical protein